MLPFSGFGSFWVRLMTNAWSDAVVTVRWCCHGCRSSSIGPTSIRQWAISIGPSKCDWVTHWNDWQLSQGKWQQPGGLWEALKCGGQSLNYWRNSQELVMQISSCMKKACSKDERVKPILLRCEIIGFNSMFICFTYLWLLTSHSSGSKAWGSNDGRH